MKKRNKTNWFWKVLIWVAFSYISLYFLFILYQGLIIDTPNNLNEHIITTDTIDTEIKSLEVWQLIQDIRLEHPAICYEHVKWESGHFKDTLVTYNNLFGMQYARKRPTLQTGHVTINKVKWGVYRDWHDSVYDYLIWQILYARGLSEQEYKEKLFRVYGAKNIKYK